MRTRGSRPGTKLEDIFAQIQSGEKARLNLMLKADVQGSLEAVTESLRQLEQRRGRADVRAPRRRRHHRERHHARRGHQRHDHRLQRASRRQGPQGGRSGRRRDPHLRDHLQAARGHRAGRWSACSTPSTRSTSPARPRSARSSGCRSTARSPVAGARRASSPVARRCASCATARSSGRARSHRCERFKDDAKEVREGFECGIGLYDFQDLKPGDIIETYEDIEIARPENDCRGTVPGRTFSEPLADMLA